MSSCGFELEMDGDKETFVPAKAKETQWLRLDTNDIPTGIVEVDVTIDDNGTEYKSIMFAGHMGAEIKEDGCTLQPTLGWTISLKGEDSVDDAEREEY